MASRHDAVLDRVLSRIAAASQRGVSPGRSSDALPQRDSAGGVRTGAAHGLTSSILDKRRQAKPGRPSTPQGSRSDRTPNSAACRDSSLAGTAVQSLLLPPGLLLKASHSLELQRAPASSNQPRQQQQQQQRHAPPQPAVATPASAAGQTSSARPAPLATPQEVPLFLKQRNSSPRAGPSSPSARTRASPRSSPRASPRGARAATVPLAYGGGNTSSTASMPGSAATITRTAALRALKQQRSATPERRDSDQPPLQPQPPQQPMPAAPQRTVSDGSAHMARHTAPDGGHTVRTAEGGGKEASAAAGQVVLGQGGVGVEAVGQTGEGASREQHRKSEQCWQRHQQEERTQDDMSSGASASVHAAVKSPSPAPRPSPVHPAMSLPRSPPPAAAPQRPEPQTDTAPCTHPLVTLDRSDSFSDSKEEAAGVDAARQQPTSSGTSPPSGSNSQAPQQRENVLPKSTSQLAASGGEADSAVQPNARGAPVEGQGFIAQPASTPATEASYLQGPLHASLLAAYTRGAGVPQAPATAVVSPPRGLGSVPARAGTSQPALVAGQRQRAGPQQQRQRSPQPRSRTPSQGGRAAAGRSAGGAGLSLPAALRPASPPPAAPAAVLAHGPMGQGPGGAAAGAQPHAHTPGWMEDVLMVAKARAQRLEEQVRGLSQQLEASLAAREELQFRLDELASQQATERQQQQQAQGQGQEQGQQQQARQHDPAEQGRHEELLKRVASLEGQLARARGANEALASQNRALYGTLDETLAAAEHAAMELRQLRAAHGKLQEEHAAQKQNAQQELSLRERALSAIQSEFASLKRRHEEQTAASDAARRDAALRDGRLRREVEAARAEAEATGQQLAKLQREHQQLLGRKAERDKQAAAMAKRVEAQQEQLAAAERLATEQAALVREVESRAALLRSRTASLDKAVAAEREARQAAQEQVRQLEEEVALLVSIVRQGDPVPMLQGVRQQRHQQQQQPGGLLALPAPEPSGEPSSGEHTGVENEPSARSLCLLPAGVGAEQPGQDEGAEAEAAEEEGLGLADGGRGTSSIGDDDRWSTETGRLAKAHGEPFSGLRGAANHHRGHGSYASGRWDASPARTPAGPAPSVASAMLAAGAAASTAAPRPASLRRAKTPPGTSAARGRYAASETTSVRRPASANRAVGGVTTAAGPAASGRPLAGVRKAWGAAGGGRGRAGTSRPVGDAVVVAAVGTVGAVGAPGSGAVEVEPWQPYPSAAEKSYVALQAKRAMAVAALAGSSLGPGGDKGAEGSSPPLWRVAADVAGRRQGGAGGAGVVMPAGARRARTPEPHAAPTWAAAQRANTSTRAASAQPHLARRPSITPDPNTAISSTGRRAHRPQGPPSVSGPPLFPPAPVGATAGAGGGPPASYSMAGSSSDTCLTRRGSGPVGRPKLSETAVELARLLLPADVVSLSAAGAAARAGRDSERDRERDRVRGPGTYTRSPAVHEGTDEQVEAEVEVEEAGGLRKAAQDGGKAAAASLDEDSTAQMASPLKLASSFYLSGSPTGSPGGGEGGEGRQAGGQGGSSPTAARPGARPAASGAEVFRASYAFDSSPGLQLGASGGGAPGSSAAACAGSSSSSALPQSSSRAARVGPEPEPEGEEEDDEEAGTSGAASGRDLDAALQRLKERRLRLLRELGSGEDADAQAPMHDSVTAEGPPHVSSAKGGGAGESDPAAASFSFQRTTHADSARAGEEPDGHHDGGRGAAHQTGAPFSVPLPGMEVSSGAEHLGGLHGAASTHRGGSRRTQGGSGSARRNVTFADECGVEPGQGGTVQQQQQQGAAAGAPRSPRRPSVTEAAAAAAAAGVGLGGPLHKLLEDLEGRGDAAAVAAVVRSAAVDTSSLAAPAASALHGKVGVPGQGAVVEQPAVLTTHFDLTKTLEGRGDVAEAHEVEEQEGDEGEEEETEEEETGGEDDAEGDSGAWGSDAGLVTAAAFGDRYTAGDDELVDEGEEGSEEGEEEGEWQEGESDEEGQHGLLVDGGGSNEGSSHGDEEEEEAWSPSWEEERLPGPPSHLLGSRSGSAHRERPRHQQQQQAGGTPAVPVPIPRRGGSGGSGGGGAVGIGVSVYDNLVFDSDHVATPGSTPRTVRVHSRMGEPQPAAVAIAAAPGSAAAGAACVSGVTHGSAAAGGPSPGCLPDVVVVPTSLFQAALLAAGAQQPEQQLSSAAGVAAGQQSGAELAAATSMAEHRGEPGAQRAEDSAVAAAEEGVADAEVELVRGRDSVSLLTPEPAKRQRVGDAPAEGAGRQGEEVGQGAGGTQGSRPGSGVKGRAVGAGASPSPGRGSPAPVPPSLAASVAAALAGPAEGGSAIGLAAPLALHAAHGTGSWEAHAHPTVQQQQQAVPVQQHQRHSLPTSPARPGSASGLYASGGPSTGAGAAGRPVRLVCGSAGGLGPPPPDAVGNLLPGRQPSSALKPLSLSEVLRRSPGPGAGR